MTAHTAHFGPLVTIFLMAVALGMDAFSLGIGVGMKGIRLLDILKISIVIGLFHVIMPLLGLFMGHYVGDLLGNIAAVIGGGLLILLGLHMIINSMQVESSHFMDHRSFWGLLVFALGVSIDSFSVGISLGIVNMVNLLFTVLMFGAFGGGMSVLGLMIGRKVGRLAGGYSEALGGVILLMFGVLFIL